MTRPGKVQILWRWKSGHAPAGESIRWHFAAHGATWERREADEMAALLKSHGKAVRLLSVPG
ncbi:MAG: hypothetical protein CMG88_03675 [Marinobacter sp.]|nr:hypothetical protein [Marinobacter sp.]MBP53644.1 hypothetical protein [Marinobacter sp.]|tara:strand:- start:663 stop:848 length:186 start_codon:yes stop_codon:yes gene_type:complete